MRLLRRVDRNVARTGDDDLLALDAVAAVLKHLLGEEHRAITGRFFADETAAVGQALAGQRAVEAILQTLVHAEHVADLATPDPNVASRHIRVRADVSMQFDHQRLTEAHHFPIRLTLRVEV